eukprot:1156131-Pelagomonas_calceolata.AAC.5
MPNQADCGLHSLQGLLRLCTRVVRGLMAKLVPDLESEDVVPDGGKNAKAASGGDRDGRPAEGGAPSGAEKQNGGGESDSLEIEEEGGEGAGGEGVESKSNEERRRAVAFENKVGLRNKACKDMGGSGGKRMHERAVSSTCEGASANVLCGCAVLLFALFMCFLKSHLRAECHLLTWTVVHGISPGKVSRQQQAFKCTFSRL